MGRIKGKRPSPATVISIVALIFAVTGTAVAGMATVSVLSKKEKQQTRNIAKDEINKAAPGLSVANAINAQSAANAAQLGGSPPGAFQQRVAGSCTDDRAISAIAANGSVTCEGAVIPIDLSGPAVDTDPPSKQIGDLQIISVCPKSAEHGVSMFNNGSSAATLNWFYSDGTTVSAGGEFLVGHIFKFDGKRLEGQFIFSSPSAKITVNLHAFDAGSSCEINGTAVFAPSS
jgi:hypothetical protein